jgi:1-acyl-sn-glycerol-3-phosphate acyltransferase
VSNHASYLDPILLAVQLRRPLCYMAKSELFENRYFSWLISSLNAYPVRQGAGDVGAIRETIRLLGEGHVLNIFPEGTRTEDGEIARMEKGIALLVRRARVPVVPVAILGSFEALPKGQKFLRPFPIRLKYGKPLHLENLKGEQIIQTIDSELRRLLGELRAAYP